MFTFIFFCPAIFSLILYSMLEINNNSCLTMQIKRGFLDECFLYYLINLNFLSVKQFFPPIYMARENSSKLELRTNGTVLKMMIRSHCSINVNCNFLYLKMVDWLIVLFFNFLSTIWRKLEIFLNFKMFLEIIVIYW